MKSRARTGALCLSLGATLAGCRDASVAAPPPAESAPTTPDRLAEDEHLPEAETAFGLPLPAGMRLVRYFDDAAYFSGEVPLDDVIEQVRKHVRAQEVQVMGQGVVFGRAQIANDDTKRLLRIEIRPSTRGTRLHVQDITPPPALTGANDAEIWRKVGRNPDGTPLNQNELY
jgi:hypothetical protein